MIEADLLKAVFAEEKLKLTDEQCALLDRYAELLVEWNQKMNLTAITEPEEIARKHFLDSAMLLSKFRVASNCRLIDVGSGAGFPGLVLAILRPDIWVTMIDSLQKRITFLEAVRDELGLKNVRFYHGRAEILGQDAAFRERYNLATARAVSDLSAVSEYCLPFIKVGGYFLPMRGSDPEADWNIGENAIHACGGMLIRVHAYILFNVGKRSLFIIKKMRKTAPKFPRPSAQMKKRPL